MIDSYAVSNNMLIIKPKRVWCVYITRTCSTVCSNCQCFDLLSCEFCLFVCLSVCLFERLYPHTGGFLKLNPDSIKMFDVSRASIMATPDSKPVMTTAGTSAAASVTNSTTRNPFIQVQST